MKRTLTTLAIVPALAMAVGSVFAGEAFYTPPTTYTDTKNYYEAPPTKSLRDMVGHVRKKPSYWVSAEGLYWDLENTEVKQTLVFANGNTNDVVIGEGDKLGEGYVPGFRASIGTWMSPDEEIGLEINGFYVPESDDELIVSGTGGGADLDVFGTTNGVPGSIAALGGGGASGTYTMNNRTEFFGAEAIAVGKLVREEWASVDWVGGFKYLNLLDDTTISTETNTSSWRDDFKATSQFFGVMGGVRARFKVEEFFVELYGTAALGGSYLELDLEGTGDPTGGGLYNYGQNIGERQEWEFAFVGETGIKFGYDFDDSVEFYAGYGALYWTTVQRSLENVNVEQAGQPITPIDSDEFIAHGGNAGIKVKF